MAKIRTEKELADALASDQDTIEIEGDLANKVFRIRATGKVAWAVAVGAIGVAVVATLAAPATGGMSEGVALGVAPAAIGVLGVSATFAAVGIAVKTGGVAALSKLRGYREVSRKDDHLVLQRR